MKPRTDPFPLANAKVPAEKQMNLLAAVLVTLGVILGMIAFIHFLVACQWPIDSPEELSVVLQRDRVVATRAALAAFIFVLGLGRRIRLGERFIAAIVVAVVLWFLTWQFLRQTHFNFIRVRGGDPETMTELLQPH